MLNSLVLDLVFPKHMNNYYNLNKSQWKSKDELIYLQNVKLKKLTKFLSRNNSYYRGLGIEKLDSIDKLKLFPLLKKEMIKENHNNLKSKNINPHRFVKSSTSGSTGEPLYFYFDRKLRNDGFGLRTDGWTGWKPGEANIYLWGAERDVKIGWKSKVKNSSLFYNKTILSSYYMKDDDMINYVKIFNKRKPKLIVGYPSSLELFAQFITLKNLKLDFIPKGIVTSGETLYEFQRELIQKTFKTQVLNRYASREVDVIASECQEKTGLHINSEHLIVEILNEKGEYCLPGEIGEIVITDLDNYVFPFIRYKIGDIGMFSPESCNCGRGLPLLKNVYGRSFDLIIGKNGNRVPGNYFTLLRYKIKGVEKFQIKQNEVNQIEVILKVNKLFTNAEKNKMIHLLKEKLGDDMLVNISEVENIPLTQSGKHRWIISNVSPFNNNQK